MECVNWLFNHKQLENDSSRPPLKISQIDNNILDEIGQALYACVMRIVLKIKMRHI